LRKQDNLAVPIKETLGIGPEMRATIRTLNAYLTALTERVESKGILVMQSGIVGNDNRKTLSVDEFQGFVVADDIAPIVFINAKDYVAARIFTLAHELAHIWVGKSGILNPDEGDIRTRTPDTELFCNAVAAEVLVPQAEFLEAFETRNGSLIDLAMHFRVSRIVILRRAFELSGGSSSAYQYVPA
jgi:Zn-dependent peptidase ImmA (M78 family)